MGRETLDIGREAEDSGLESGVLSLEPIVVFYPDGKCVNADVGENLLELARSAGVSIDSSCGGRGACGRCKVLIKYGEVGSKAQDSRHKTQDSRLRTQDTRRKTQELEEGEDASGLEPGYVLACQAEVIGDVVVEVPASSQFGEFQILQSGTEPAVDLESLTPLTQKVDVVLNAPSLEDNSSDLERLVRGIRKTQDTRRKTQDKRAGTDSLGSSYASSSTLVSLDVLRGLPGLLRESNWQVTVTLTDSRGMPEITDVQPIVESRHNYGLGIDVGTTTIVVHLIDLDTGVSLGVQAEYNRQIEYGDDVIARIIYTSEKEDGLEELKDAVVGTINSLIADLIDSNQISPRDITCVVCAGNTTMTHLLLGIAPVSIRREPYIPVAQWVPIMSADKIGLNVNPDAVVHCLPAVGGYVGGDIAAGVLATGMAESSSLSMLIDVGTNGEIVLGNNEWLMCCSCSAGPAFEGCGLQHGMHATAGAIERLEYNPDNDEVIFSTIGGKMPPRGICGSGLIDAMATLLKSGAMDRAGKINLSWPSPRIRIVDDEPQFVFVWGREVGREDDIFLTESDIQNLMRSKSAVYAGTKLLLESLGLSAADVEQIRIAGGFGNYLDIENAVVIGLLPDISLDRIRFVGNTSAAGARMALLSRDARRKVEETSRKMTYVELMAEGNRFMDEFVAGLFLPHTDTSLFPSVMEKLSAISSQHSAKSKLKADS
jgi:uncharacterized 2Fe-2S/4Fe-4S cluster protein (DUF4445 family)